MRNIYFAGAPVNGGRPAVPRGDYCGHFPHGHETQAAPAL